MPWKNGGGTTREIARHPATGEFDWRLSVAEVAADGPFSTFAGCQRILVLLAGEGMVLHIGDREAVPVHALDSIELSGEWPVTAALLGGPTVDLNLIWRREAFGTVVHRVIHIGGTATLGEGRGLHVAYVLSGPLVLADGRSLGESDTVVWHDGELILEGDGAIALFGLGPRRGR
jgi:environmental stress-induced protein Ves